MTRRDVHALFDTGIEYPDIPSEKHPDGKTYKVASPNAKDGLWLASLADLGLRSALGGELNEDELSELQLDDDAEKDFRRRVLGPALDEMITDGVDWELVKGLTNDAFAFFARDRELADQLLAQRGEEVARANRAARRKTQHTAKKTAGSKSSRASTATRASTTGRGSTRSSTSPKEPKAKAG